LPEVRELKAQARERGTRTTKKKGAHTGTPKKERGKEKKAKPPFADDDAALAAICTVGGTDTGDSGQSC
jgi:hypothetical protein